MSHQAKIFKYPLPNFRSILFVIGKSSESLVKLKTARQFFRALFLFLLCLVGFYYGEKHEQFVLHP